MREIFDKCPRTLLNCNCAIAGVEFGLPPFRVDSNEMGRWFTAGLKYAQVCVALFSMLRSGLPVLLDYLCLQHPSSQGPV